MSDHRTNAYTYLVVLSANMLSLSMGISVSWTSPILVKLQDENNPDNLLGYAISNDQLTWIGSLLSVGSICGALPAGFLGNKIGRKYTLLLMGILYLFSFITGAFAKTIELYYFLRILMGIAISGTTLISMYISEIAHPEDRGYLSTSIMIVVYLGMLVSLVLGPYLSIIWFNLICAASASVFCISFFLLAPESPHYLISRGRNAYAYEVLNKLRSEPGEVVKKEFEEMEEHVQKHEEASLKEIFRSKLLVKCLLIAMGVALFYHFTGVLTILTYSQVIFESTGANFSSAMSSIIVGSCQMVTSILATFVVRKLRFKLLLVVTFGAVVISHVLTGLYFYFKEVSDRDLYSYGWWPMTTIMAAAVSNSLGIAPLFGVVLSELFPTSCRSSAFTIVQTFGFILSFVLSKFFTNIYDAMGSYGVFWFFASSSAVGTIFIKVFLVETNGKTFEEIQEILAHTYK